MEGIPPRIAQSLAAFRRDLPELLKGHYYEWVAYSGDQRIGFSSSKADLYQECFRRGFRRGEFIVASVEPDVARETDVFLDA